LLLPIQIECRYVVLMVSEVFGERSYAIAITVVAIPELLWNLDKPCWKKEGLKPVKSLSNHLLLSKHHHNVHCETRVPHHTPDSDTV